jgi:hypothetical protein
VEDWWLAGLVLAISVAAFLYGVFRERRLWAAHRGLTVKEARERLQEEPVTAADLKMWRRTIAFRLFAAFVLAL